MCWVMPPASPAATSVSRLEVLGGVVELRLLVGLVGRADDLDLLVELVGENLDGVVGQRLRERRHLAEAHELLDHLGHRDAEVLGDVLDRRARVDLDDVGLQDADVLRDRLGVGAAPAPAAAPRRTSLGAAARTAAAAGRLGVDDHAPDAAGRAGGALALQRGARGPARGAALVAATAAAVGLLIGLGLGAGLRRHALRRAGAEVADAEIARRAQLLARGLLGPLAVRVLRLLLAGERGVGGGLVHGGGRRLHGDAG